jgi:hypothetical protein
MGIWDQRTPLPERIAALLARDRNVDTRTKYRLAIQHFIGIATLAFMACSLHGGIENRAGNHGMAEKKPDIWISADYLIVDSKVARSTSVLGDRQGVGVPALAQSIKSLYANGSRSDTAFVEIHPRVAFAAAYGTADAIARSARFTHIAFLSNAQGQTRNPKYAITLPVRTVSDLGSISAHAPPHADTNLLSVTCVVGDSVIWLGVRGGWLPSVNCRSAGWDGTVSRMFDKVRSRWPNIPDGAHISVAAVGSVTWRHIEAVIPVLRKQGFTEVAFAKLECESDWRVRR